MGESIKVALVFALFGIGLIASALLKDQGTLELGGRHEEPGSTVFRFGQEGDPPSIDTGIPVRPFVIVLEVRRLAR